MTGERDKAEKILSGVVIADRADKTVRVRVARLVKHPVYGKIMRRHNTVQAHDESNEYRVGDQVLMASCARVSKTKSWRVTGKADKK